MHRSFLAPVLLTSLLSSQIAKAEQNCSLPEGTPLEIEVIEPVASQTAAIGDKFRIRLYRPVVVSGMTVLSAGALGVGQVIHVMRPKGGGRAGELILAARYLEVGSVHVPIRGFRINSTGREIYGSTYVSGVTVLETRDGQETVVPAGTVSLGRVAQTTLVVCKEGGEL